MKNVLMKPILKKITFSLFGLLAIQPIKASEFFVKINRAGQHTVLVGDQYQTNTSNIYRFFELPAGTATIKISDGNTGNLVYDGTVTLGVNERLVTELNASGNLTSINSSTVTYSNWYTQNGTSTNTSPPPPPPPPVEAYTGAVSSEKFAEIVSAIKSQTVESYKVEKGKSIVKKHMFTSKQVAEMCNLFKIESYKLDFAKFAYDYTVDKDNYFNVGKTFKIASYSRELDEYIDAK